MVGFVFNFEKERKVSSNDNYYYYYYYDEGSKTSHKAPKSRSGAKRKK